MKIEEMLKTEDGQKLVRAFAQKFNCEFMVPEPWGMEIQMAHGRTWYELDDKVDDLIKQSLIEGKNLLVNAYKDTAFVEEYGVSY